MNWKVAGALLALGITTACSDGSKGKVVLGASAPPTLSAANEKILGDFRNAIADMADKVLPVIVSVQTEAHATQSEAQGVDPFEFFFGPGMGQGQPRGQQRQAPKQEGLGSGVIVSKEGYILTNNHVVEGADVITVTLNDKREFTAKVVGTDPQTDVALIKLEKAPVDLPVAYLGKSESLRVGEWVVAIGNPFGLSRTVTTGIVSAKGVHNRGITSYEDFIQTDAAINPGNSGGGLFNLAGELVVINTAILSSTGGFLGIGFAIPIDLARGVMQDLLVDGKVSRGWLGVSIQDIDPKLAKAMHLDTVQGALIAEVFAEGPADKSGLQAGDLVTQINGQMVRDANGLRYAISMIKPGEKAELTIWRDNKVQKISVRVGSREDAPEVADAEGGNKSNDWLGIEVASLEEQARREAGLKDGAVIVRKLKEDGLAAAAGLQPNDIILQINHKPTTSTKAFFDILKQEAKSPALLFLIKRGAGRLFVVVER